MIEVFFSSGVRFFLAGQSTFVLRCLYHDERELVPDPRHQTQENTIQDWKSNLKWRVPLVFVSGEVHEQPKHQPNEQVRHDVDFPGLATPFVQLAVHTVQIFAQR
jgi:hypothetical protein